MALIALGGPSRGKIWGKMKQVLFSFLWIVAGTVLGLSICAFDMLFCLESRLDWRTAGFLAAGLVTEALIFRLSAKTETLPVNIISLCVCLALVVFGIEISGLQHMDFSQTDRFSRLVERQPWFRISLLVLFVLPLISLGFHAFRRRKGK